MLFSWFTCFSHTPAWHPSLAHVVDLMSSLPDLWIMFPSCSMRVTDMTIVSCMSRATACIFLMTLIEFLFTRAWETYTCVVLTAMVHWPYYCLLVMQTSIEQTALSSTPLLLSAFVLVCRHDGKHHNIFNRCHVLPRCRCTHSHARLNCFMHHRHVIDVLRWPSFRSRTLTMHLLTLISRQRLILI